MIDESNGLRARGPTASELIASLRTRSVGWRVAVGEWLDNSIGNGAQHVSVWFRKCGVEIEDNGAGCDDKMFPAWASIGWHQKSPDSKDTVSRYGVGAKDGFLWAGGPTKLYSVRQDLYQYTEVNWDEFGDEWDFDRPETGEGAKGICKRVGLTGDSGAKIILPSVTRKMTETIFWQMHDALNERFWPAVENGATLLIEMSHQKKKVRIGGPLKGKPMVTFIDDKSIDKECRLEDGRTIRIHAGIVAEEVRLPHPGFDYIYGHRVLIPTTSLGSGDMDCERVYGRVYLLGDKTDWRVATNKTGLHDTDRDIVAQAVFGEVKHLLEEASSEAFCRIQDDALLKEVTAVVNAALRRKAKRNSGGGKSGTARSTGKGTPHSNASNASDNPGNCSTTDSNDDRPGAVTIKWGEYSASDWELGDADVLGQIVRLNKHHPYNARANQDDNKQGLASVALALWSDAWRLTDDSGQKRLIDRDDDSETPAAEMFQRKYSELMQRACM